MIPKSFVVSIFMTLALAIHSEPATAEAKIAAAEARAIAKSTSARSGRRLVAPALPPDRVHVTARPRLPRGPHSPGHCLPPLTLTRRDARSRWCAAAGKPPRSWCRVSSAGPAGLMRIG